MLDVKQDSLLDLLIRPDQVAVVVVFHFSAEGGSMTCSADQTHEQPERRRRSRSDHRPDVSDSAERPGVWMVACGSGSAVVGSLHANHVLKVTTSGPAGVGMQRIELGANLHAYLRNTPLGAQDPAGLFVLAEEMEGFSLRGMIQGLLSAAATDFSMLTARATVYFGGMAASAGTWAIHASTRGGALVANLNLDAIFMAEQWGAANEPEWEREYREFVNRMGGEDPDDWFTPRGREISEHALARMRERNIPATDVDVVIDSAKGVLDSEGKWNYYLRAYDVTVVYNAQANRSVTVIDGLARPH